MTSVITLMTINVGMSPFSFILGWIIVAYSNCKSPSAVHFLGKINLTGPLSALSRR